MSAPFGNIEVRGARENNLKNVTFQIPKRKPTIFTGVSGSGKSSIVFDTLATEAQRQLYETFRSITRTDCESPLTCGHPQHGRIVDERVCVEISA
jgi:excinuclease UvrABC ATPase subunit